MHEHVVVIPAHAPYTTGTSETGGSTDGQTHAGPASGAAGTGGSTDGQTASGKGGSIDGQTPPGRAKPGRFAFLTNHCVQSAHSDYEASPQPEALHLTP